MDAGKKREACSPCPEILGKSRQKEGAGSQI